MEALAELEEERRKAKDIRKETAGAGKRRYIPAMPRGVASNEMCTFLILNISSLQLIPAEYLLFHQKKKTQAKTETDKYSAEKAYNLYSELLQKYKGGIDIIFNEYDGIDTLYAQGGFITAFFPSDRQTNCERGTWGASSQVHDSLKDAAILCQKRR